jgi:hypothetical protein
MLEVIPLLMLLSGPGGAGLAAQTAPQATLEGGIRQVNEGDLENAVITLDAVIQQLAREAHARAKELSQAHLYKGVALVGLQQEEPAKASFREALRYDPELRLGKGQFPDRTVRVFEAARKGSTKSVMKRPSGAPKKAGIGGGAIAAIVGGVLAAGGGVALASGAGEPANVAPTGAVSVSPEGRAIAGVTELTFTATASDPDGDPLTYQWTLGDGTTASGATVRHRYASAGSFNAQLVIADGHGGSASASAAVTVERIDGPWTGCWLPTFSQTGDGTTLTGLLLAIAPPREIVGELRSPRSISWSTIFPRGQNSFLRYEGTFDPTLQRIEGVITGVGVNGDESRSGCTHVR